MVDLPALTGATALTTWRIDPLPLLAAAVLAVGQLLAVARVRRRGVAWPWWRPVVSLALGPVTLVLATCSFVAVYRSVLFWPAALANTVLAVVTPAGVALGDPVRLLAAGRSGPPSSAAKGVARLFDLPLVGALAGVVVQLTLYLSPWFTATLRSGLMRGLTALALVAVGALFAVPVFGEADDDGPTASGRRGLGVLLALVDGVADAVPGLVVAVSGAVVAGGWYATHYLAGGPTRAYDQMVGGTLMVTVAESVGAPLLVIACMRWARADARLAAEEDRLLDALEAQRVSPPEGLRDS